MESNYYRVLVVDDEEPTRKLITYYSKNKNKVIESESLGEDRHER